MLNYFVFAVIYMCAIVQAAYFSMSNIAVNVPHDRTKYPPTDHTLLTLYALKENESEEKNQEHLKYSLVSSGERVLQVYPSMGDIMFTKNFFSRLDIRNITVQASVEDTSGMRDTTTVQVIISTEKTLLDCDFITLDLCYWHSASYRIFENRKSTVIGSLSSPYLAEMCAGHKLNYALLEGGNQFGLVAPSDSSKSWKIRSLKSLDRDVERSMKLFNRKSTESGEYRNLSVQCTVENPEGAIREIAKVISVKILDEDDNPPIAQTKLETIPVHLHSNLVHKGELVEHRDLIFTDRDSPPVNEYTIKILDDFLHILDPNCSTYEDDRDGESQTALHCKLIFTKDMQIHGSPYAVVLEINDTTLLPGFGNSVVRVPIHIYFLNYQDYPQPLDQTLPLRELNRPLLLYPSREVAIFKTAAPYARVTQPHEEKLKKGIEIFRIASDSSKGAFQVTEKDGIVYVDDLELLRNAGPSVSLTIEWLTNNTRQIDEILINLVNEPNHTCTNQSPLAKNWGSCSIFKNKKSCNKGCGLSTGGSPGFQWRKAHGAERCVWRGDQNPGMIPTRLYATCTPDVATCPDGICDDLENLSAYICPQDCAPAAKLPFPMQVNRRTGRGFEIGEGICFCDKFAMCLCEYPEIKKKSKEKTSTTEAPAVTTAAIILMNNSVYNFDRNSTIVQPNVSRHVAADISKCGTTCIFGITGSALFLLIVVVGVMFCWRLERVHKAVRQKFSNETPDLQVPLSDYVGRGAPPDTLRFNFDVTTTLTSQINRNEPDPKWEFPRSQLSIEQTLGEGEFGRVLRAQALEVAGQAGYSTVAVKTLKDDAGERELADLLSEYQLLKEVSHPNIIRLLGASTLPGGPVYLIIEYAEHGSLRNYLRRSRHLRTDLRITSNRIENIQLDHEPYDEPKPCQVTPKDLLSFAWQIANGMSYLADIKLVHRDLAARNILVAAGKICKISDFGLTRDVYEDDAYFKRSKGRVPVKWMAPESLSDHVYTNKSDVWSYGILIWELVTLGASPYPGIAVQSLFHLLKTGYRMERPENCSLALYKVMRSCWHTDSEKRPTFSDLSLRFERMLSDEVQYLDLSGNAVYNRGYFCDNLDDVEVEVENEENTRKTNTDAINYMNRSADYEKCGNVTKIEMPPEEKENLLASPVNLQNSIGYESPIKIQNKAQEVKTPLNEFPQYGYTDMTACNSK